MKKSIIAVISVGAAAVIAAGGFGIFKLTQKQANPVKVQPVSDLIEDMGDMSSMMNGTITSNATQNIYLSSEELVAEVFVSEGDQVKIGDKLLAYDTTWNEILLAEVKLEAQQNELDIKIAEKTLENLKNGIVNDDDNPGSDYTPSDSEDDEEDPDDDYEPDDDEARALGSLIKTAALMTAVSENGTETETQSTTSAAESETPATEAESETETVEQTEESPLAEIKAYKKLKYDSKPYQGDGTKEDPYLFFCKDGTEIQASFMNKMLGFNEAGTSKKKGGMRGDGTGSYARLEIREGDAITGGFVKSVTINGTVKADKAYEPDITWTFTSEGVTKNVPEVDDPLGGDDDNDDDDDLFDDGAGGFDDDDSYSAEDIKNMIADKEEDIVELKLTQRELEIKVKQAQRKVDQSIVTANINGVVKSVGDPEIGQVDNNAFLSVTSDTGLYVRGTISELKLGKIGVGSVITGYTDESGVPFEAEITSVSDYPDTGESYAYYDGYENPNSSKYSFLAYIEESDGLSDGEWANLKIDGSQGGSTGLYISKAYIRNEGGQSYVFIADEKNQLAKQYIKTGATMWDYVEITDGLTYEDQIAFPYGKNVKEGAPAVNEDDYEMLEDEDEMNSDGLEDEFDEINEFNGGAGEGMVIEEAIELN